MSKGRLWMRSADGLYHFEEVLMIDRLVAAFADLISGDNQDGWTMRECVINGEKSMMICYFHPDSETGVDIVPMFVGVTKSMHLINEQGKQEVFRPCLGCDDAECNDREDGSHASSERQH
jgi:hypothetical protein